MDIDPDRALAEAARRWPSVRWDAERYRSRLASDGPKFPIDLYLAAAAGDRLDSAWHAIQFEFGPQAIRLLRGMPLADFSAEELWSETLIRLLEDDSSSGRSPDGRTRASIARYRGAVPLLSYLVVIARRIAVGRHRRLRPQVSVEDSALMLLDELIDQGHPSPESAVRQQQGQERIRQTVKTAFARLDPDVQQLIALVYRDGMKQKEAGVRLGWSESKTSRQMDAAREALRFALADLAEITWTPAAASAWDEIWNECWKS
jgi:RNA polymerase sigma factor (sigma-70 family)